MANYHIYTDGSARFNPGPGGWGMLVMNEDDTQILFKEHDSEDNVTNNRMELKAMICAFEYAESHPNDYFIIYSDSAYVVNSINSWIPNWATNGWRNSKKQLVENIDCMQALYDFIKRDFFNAEVKKCKGHEGETGNELADALATNNMKRFRDLAAYWTDEDIEPDSEPAGDNWFPND